mgnify:CR=1 FL=1
MNKKPRRKLDHERIIYVAVDFAVDVIKNVGKGLFRELERKIDNYSNNPNEELIETSKDLITHINIPGVPKEYIIIDLTEKKLEIRAGIDKNGIMKSKLKKEINLPKLIVVEESSADYENGILTVTMPKKVKKIRYEVPDN